MSKEHPDLGKLKIWVVDQYIKQGGSIVRLEDSTDDQNKEFARWLAFQEVRGGSLIRKWPRLETILYSDYSSKINAISQRHCSICGRAAPWGRFVVRITPISPQTTASKKGLFAAFQAAFVERFADRPIGIDTSGALCLALTFVLDSKNLIAT